MEGITAVAKQNTPLTFSPNLLDKCGNAGITSRGTIDCLTTLPKHFLVSIKIRMAIVHLNDGQRRPIYHDLYSLSEVRPGLVGSVQAEERQPWRQVASAAYWSVIQNTSIAIIRIASSIFYSKSHRCLTNKYTPTQVTEEEQWERVSR